MGYIKTIINELEQRVKKNSRDLYRRINYFKKGYQARTNIEKDEKDDWLQTPTVF
jgi:hypothetical protein